MTMRLSGTVTKIWRLKILKYWTHGLGHRKKRKREREKKGEGKKGKRKVEGEKKGKGEKEKMKGKGKGREMVRGCLLYTSDAADE